MSSTKPTTMTMMASNAPPMAYAPSNYLGAARIAYAPDDVIAATPVAPVAEPVAAAPVAAPVAEPVAPASVLYPDKPVEPVVAADPVVEPAADPVAPAGPELTGLSPEDAAAVTAAWQAKEDAKAARKVELDAMTPEDRALAEAADTAAEADAVRLETIPADGKYDLRMPDGVALDQGLLDALSPDLAGLNLTNGEAQTLADRFIAHQQARGAEQSEAWAKTLNGWVETAKKDPEIGGPKWDATVTAATGAIAKFGTPELQEYLEHSGGGNHAEMIRAWAKVGLALGDDNPITGDPPGKPTAPADPAATLYPHDLPKGK